MPLSASAAGNMFEGLLITAMRKCQRFAESVDACDTLPPLLLLLLLSLLLLLLLLLLSQHHWHYPS
jgi:hypothetical protein